MSSPYQRRSQQSRLRSRRPAIFIFQLFWVITVIWCQFGAFFYSLTHCRWPDKVLEWSARATKPTRVLLITDAQVPNPATARRSWWGENHVTTYLRKSWRVTSRLHPDVVIFLGDMLSSGRYVTSKEEYDAYYRRFASIFRHGDETTFYFIPGNTDIGLGPSSSFSEDASRFFTEYFGPLNQAITIAGHEFVLIDAPKLVEEDYHRHAHGKTFEEWTPLSGGPIAFLASTVNKQHDKPVILLSHIPLSRPARQSCGTFREKGSIRAGAGHGYQNMLGKQTTEFILKTLQPSVVFSGDNRDYCEVVHEVVSPHDADAKREVREVTVKSFSPSRHIRWPGFQLISLISPDHEGSVGPTIADTSCYLPDTKTMYKSIYLPSLVLTAVVLLYINVTPRRRHRRVSSLSLAPRPHSPGPESAVWSAWSPRSKFLTSPTNPLPPNLRVPSARTPSYRVTSLSCTPQSSPLLSPITLFPTEDEMDDPLSPTHYLAHSDHRDGQSEGWTTVHENEGFLGEGAAFLPPPRVQPQRTSWWSWTRSFKLKGRRRRITISVPRWDACHELFPSRGQSLLHRARGLLSRFIYDAIRVAFPALIARVVLDWIIS
ncbi:Metallo-dependent phosphatase-like protein [Scleroderma yunnanense]